MTPLIKRIVSDFDRSSIKGVRWLHALDPTSYHWFDIDAATNADVAAPVNTEAAFKLPFPHVALAMEGEAPFFIALFQRYANTHEFDIVVPSRNRVVSGYVCLGDDNKTTCQVVDAVGNRKIGQAEADNFATMVQLSRVTLFNVLNQPSPVEAYTSEKAKPKKGQGLSKPLYAWHTVAIEPKAPKQEPKGGTHASPRPHDRRGHYRTYKSGKQVWVRNMRVGKGEGFVFKDYIVK